jgi:hypothetical protein
MDLNAHDYSALSALKSALTRKQGKRRQECNPPHEYVALRAVLLGQVMHRRTPALLRLAAYPCW